MTEQNFIIVERTITRHCRKCGDKFNLRPTPDQTLSGFCIVCRRIGGASKTKSEYLASQDGIEWIASLTQRLTPSQRATKKYQQSDKGKAAVIRNNKKAAEKRRKEKGVI